MDAADQPSSRPLGATFAAERERQGLSRADVAHRLHMSVSQVEALEAGDYSRLPRGTFLRGFVRNYARALGMDVDVAINTLAGTAPRDAPPRIVVASQNIRFDPLGERFANPYLRAAALATVAVLLGFAGMYWWVFVRPTSPALAARPTVEPRAPVAAPAIAAPKVAEPVAEPVPVVEPAKPVPEPVPVATAPAPAPAKPAVAARPPVVPAASNEPPMDPAPVIAAGGSVIRFKFKGNSWVEIKDGRGKLLLSRNNPGGSEAEVMGKPPFVVVVGNAPEVQMYYNNREFDLEPHTRVAVARFIVE